MTMPHLMNCLHSDDGWCLSCVKEMHQELESIKQQGGFASNEGKDGDYRRIADLITELSGIHANWGNTCVYVGHLSWGAKALWDYEGAEQGNKEITSSWLRDELEFCEHQGIGLSLETIPGLYLAWSEDIGLTLGGAQTSMCRRREVLSLLEAMGCRE